MRTRCAASVACLEVRAARSEERAQRAHGAAARGPVQRGAVVAVARVGAGAERQNALRALREGRGVSD